MNLSRCRFLLLFMTPLALCQVAHQTDPASRVDEREALVRSLYQQVLAHQRAGVPKGANMKIFAPYLSKTLLSRIDAARACLGDWLRQNPDPNLKPEFGWLELGLFSGENERANPRTFKILKTEQENDGSFQVFVSLTYSEPPALKMNWQVVAIVVQENGHFAVNDIIYLKDEVLDVESRLSNALTAGCDGPRWVGFGNQQGKPRQQW